MRKGDKKLHFADRFIGIPVTFVLGILASKKNRPESFNRIALFQGNAVGDTVLLLGVIKDLRREFPNSEIVFFVGPTNHEIALMNKDIDKIVKLPMAAPLAAAKMIRREGMFDVFVDFMAWPRISSILTHFAKAKMKIGFRTPGQYRHYVYDFTVDHSDRVHERINFSNLLRLIGVEPESLPEIEITDHQSDSRSIVLHMFPSGSKAYLKMWPEENWKKVALHLLNKGYKVCITGGPADREGGERFASTFGYGNFFNYAGKLSLIETIKILKNSQLVISVNTGIMHIAAALDSNLIVLNGPTSNVRWGPTNKNSISINSPHKDAPCLNLGFEYKCHNNACNCMALITVETVIERATDLLEA